MLLPIMSSDKKVGKRFITGHLQKTRLAFRDARRVFFINFYTVIIYKKYIANKSIGNLYSSIWFILMTQKRPDTIKIFLTNKTYTHILLHLDIIPIF